MIDHCAADYCPTCGQPRERVGDVARGGLTLKGHTLVFEGRRATLRPGVANFARALMERGAASREFLTLRVCPETESNLIHVYATFLRKQLRELTGGAVVLHTIHSWGYELGRRDEQAVAA